MSSQRTRRGRISYRYLEPERMGQERGRERFHMTFQADGRRTLSAVCESDEAPSVLRHVTMTYGADGRPTEAFVRMEVAGEYMGSGWFDLRERYATLEGRKAKGGRLSNRIDLDQPLAFIGCDPIVSDAWHMANYDLSASPGRQHTDGLLSSADARGATGPMLWALRTGMQFVGPETLEVAAGRFEALHFQIVDTAGQMQEEHPPYDIWTTADGDYIALRAEGSQRRYELVELHDGW
jgi:hypothetical protein